MGWESPSFPSMDVSSSGDELDVQGDQEPRRDLEEGAAELVEDLVEEQVKLRMEQMEGATPKDAFMPEGENDEQTDLMEPEVLPPSEDTQAQLPAQPNEDPNLLLADENEPLGDVTLRTGDGRVLSMITRPSGEGVQVWTRIYVNGAQTDQIPGLISKAEARDWAISEQDRCQFNRMVQRSVESLQAASTVFEFAGGARGPEEAASGFDDVDASDIRSAFTTRD